MKIAKLIRCIRGGHWHSLYHDYLTPQWAKDNSPPFGDYNYYGYSTKPWEYIGDVYRKLKWFYQRGKRGYSDNSVWSLDWYLCEWMPQALRELKEQVHGTPIVDTGRVIEDPNDCDTLTMEEWKATIEYLAETFDIGRQIQDYGYKTPEEYQKAYKRFQHGMRMFNEYFFNLWD